MIDALKKSEERFDVEINAKELDSVVNRNNERIMKDF
jgi:hypothetical protein